MKRTLAIAGLALVLGLSPAVWGQTTGDAVTLAGTGVTARFAVQHVSNAQSKTAIDVTPVGWRRAYYGGYGPYGYGGYYRPYAYYSNYYSPYGYNYYANRPYYSFYSPPAWGGAYYSGYRGWNRPYYSGYYW